MPTFAVCDSVDSLDSPQRPHPVQRDRRDIMTMGAFFIASERSDRSTWRVCRSFIRPSVSFLVFTARQLC